MPHNVYRSDTVFTVLVVVGQVCLISQVSTYICLNLFTFLLLIFIELRMNHPIFVIGLKLNHVSFICITRYIIIILHT